MRLLRGSALVIDADSHVACGLVRALRLDANARAVHSLKAAREALDGTTPWSGIIIDDVLPDGRGSEVLDETRVRVDGAPVLLIAGEHDQQLLRRAHRARCDYLPKPINPDDLRSFVFDAAAFESTRDLDVTRLIATRFEHCKLSNAELAVMKMAMEGMRRSEICHALRWTQNTYRSCVRGLLQKADAVGEGLERLAFRILREARGISPRR